jgi:hypothetical protein
MALSNSDLAKLLDLARNAAQTQLSRLGYDELSEAIRALEALGVTFTVPA